MIAVDVLDEKLELARELGAEFTVNATREDPVEAIKALGGADQAIALAVSPRRSSRPTAHCAAAGSSCSSRSRRQRGDAADLETVLNGITVVGSIVGTRADLREVFELHAAGKTKVIREVRPLTRVNESIADVEAGRVAARIVFAL